MTRWLAGLSVAAALLAGCAAGQLAQGGSGRNRPAPRPQVRQWAPRPYPIGEVNLIAMGDWGTGDNSQKKVAATLARYVAATGIQFNGALLPGDNFYVRLSGIHDMQWQTLFEDMYDPARLNFPFYGVLGNHDFEQQGKKARYQLEYTYANPRSRWKMPARFYRLDLPDERPLVTVLMLDSNKPKMRREEWKRQLRWIDEQLSDRQGSRWTLCLAHHPLFSNGSHGDNGVLIREWGTLFRKHALDFYVNGHDHDLQHLEIPGWPTSFIIAGGGGRGTTAMRRNNRGPFSRKLHGFAHLQFFPDHAVVRFINGDNGQVVHTLHRDLDGAVSILQTTGRDKPTTQPLRVILGLPERGLEKVKANVPSLDEIKKTLKQAATRPAERNDQ
jgi:hypothetical protein